MSDLLPGTPAAAEFPGTNRSTSATIPPNILRSLAVLADEDGTDLEPLLADSGLDESMLRSPALRVSYRQGAAVIQRALAVTGDEHLGLRVGAVQHPTSWGLLGFALMAADTMEHAIQTGVKYQNLSGAMLAWSAAWEPEGFVVRVELPDPALDPAVAVFLMEEAFGGAVALTRLTVSPRFTPLRVEFAFTAPFDVEQFSRFFGCPVVFRAAHNRLVFEPACARTVLPGRDPVVYASVLELLDSEMAVRRDRQELLELLEVSIAQALPTVPTFAEQARRRSASERTLRRRLAECGTTYEQLVDGVRRERVDLLLHRPELTVRDIAHQAGFSDDRALRRAVRRWHGMGPLEVRKRLE